MVKENKNTMLIVGIVLVAIFIFSQNQGTGGDEPLNKPGDILVVNLYDADGNKLEQSLAGRQSTIGGVQGVAFINFDTVVTNTGEIGLSNMRITTSEPLALRQAYQDAVTIANFDAGATQTWSSELIDVSEFEGQTVDFQVFISGDYMDANGDSQSLQRTGEKSITIEQDTCIDGTPWDTCSASLPQYCDSGTLIDKATVCGCPSGYEPSSVNPDACVVPTCIDGTETNTCTSGKPEYCDGNKDIINNCAACGCPDDYYGNIQECQPDGSCEPQSYNIDFTISLGYE